MWQTLTQVADLLLHFRSPDLRLGKRQSRIHLGAFVTGGGQPRIFHHALAILNQTKYGRAVRMRRNHLLWTFISHHVLCAQVQENLLGHYPMTTSPG